MAKNDNKLTFITPRGTAIYPKLNKPDTKFNPEGVYECKLRIEAGAADGVVGGKLTTIEDIIERVTALRDAFVAEKAEEMAAAKDPKAKAKARTIKTKDFGEPDLDEDGNETGNFILKAKMKATGTNAKGEAWTRKPALFDAKNKKLPDTAPHVYGGSVLKLAVTAVPYYSAVENVVGVSLYLDAAQVIELVSAGGGRSAEAIGFAIEDGYEAAGEDTFEDESTDSSEDF